MGCFGSRFDRRNDASGDFNTVSAQFIGGDEGHEFDGFPYDRVLWALDNKKEPAEHFDIGDDMTAKNEDQVKAAYKDLIALANKHLKDAESQAKGDKPAAIKNKFNAKDVLAHW